MPLTSPPGKTSSHRIFVFLNSRGKGLEFGKVAVFYLGQPGIEGLSRAAAQHLGKLLNQVIGQIDFQVDLTELDERLLLLDTQLFRAAKKETGKRLVVGSEEEGSSMRRL